MEGRDGQPMTSVTKTITYSSVVELSRVIHPGIPRWPGDPPVEFHEVARLESDGYYLRRFSMGEHSGTHMNAPNAFFPRGIGIDGYPPESLVAPAVVIDVRDRTAADPDYALDQAAVLSWESRHGIVPAGSVVLLSTGWQAKWDDPQAYLGISSSGGRHFPGFGYDAALFLLKERGIAGMGIDTHGLERGQDEGFTVNKLVLEQPRIALENLGNLDLLPATGVTLVIGVPRLKGGSGAPVSVLAFVP